MTFRRDISDDWMNSTLWIEDFAQDAAQLYLKIKVYLIRHPSTLLIYKTEAGEEKVVQSQDWDSYSSYHWPHALKRVVETNWNDHLYLVPDAEWRTDQWTPEFTPCIVCRLQIEFAPRNEAHVLINSYRLAEGAFYRSSMPVPRDPWRGLCGFAPGCNEGTLDTNDVRPKSSGQIAAVHEFGHYIGLDHTNRAAALAARQSGNSTVAYEGPDVMGRGADIVSWHAYPWCRRLRRHLGGEQPTDEDWDPGSGHGRLYWRTGRGDSECRWSVYDERPSSGYPVIWHGNRSGV